MEAERASVLRTKSLAFAIRTVRLCKVLSGRGDERILLKQLLRSGTAVGAMVRESEQAQSRADFVNKLSIALKEANETDYWLELLRDTSSLTGKEYESISADCRELLRLLVSSIKTAKNSISSKTNAIDKEKRTPTANS